MKSILIFGIGGHAKVVADAVAKSDEYQVAAFVEPTRAGHSRFLGCPVITDEEIASVGITAGLVAIGHNHLRTRVAERVKSHFPDFEFVSIIHPSALIGTGVTLGEGCVVFAGAVINPAVKIGKHVIVNTGSLIDHDCVIHDGSSIAPGAKLGGGVVIEPGVAVSIGATIIHGVRVGANTVVGAGAVVVSDLPNGVVAYGVPCREVRTRVPSEPYL